ncbi:DUF4177 domain-containing protein [Rubellimicrobium rubrum]|uniref:DUF4177 domain-containing protein n=1 Tax=Rubellimicrobium rubrum TaxID=2585369 RepID=A0A5C4N5K5_9RHOB|nr:DUF4177 domain-containing protein [Rubellimicrobium rubrum]TNC52938.1 DUF4177 domain-containing protein [Rubellimicrobium rubrum]
MQSHEYRVIPAPRRGVKIKGARTPEDRFARAVEGEMNRMALDGWEFVRSDTLPCEQKAGWFSKPTTVFQTLLVFRRSKVEEATVPVGAAMPPPLAHATMPPAVPPLADLSAPARSLGLPDLQPAAAPAPSAPPHLALVEPPRAAESRHAAE